MSGDDAAPLADRFRVAGCDWIVPTWPVPAGVDAFMTTRNGGVSAGSYASLDLGLPGARRASRDDVGAIVENRRRVRAWLPAAPVWLDQVHGATVATVGTGGAPASAVADAAVTRERGVVLAVQTADCLPVFLADREGSVIGLAHGGWRGIAANVIENTLAAMDTRLADIVAWLGPAIGPAAFEVGVDVRDAFVAHDPDAAAAFRAKAHGKWWADLYALARRRLERAGVTDVHGGGFCTYGEPARFFSYRRDGETGRMAALLWLRPARSS